MYRDSRGRFASAVEPSPSTVEPSLTYPFLSAHALTPGQDTESRSGDYAGSLLGYSVGLHIHTPDDGWYEAEPERPVHFIVQFHKLAAVYPSYVQIRDDFMMVTYLSDEQRQWRERIIRDHEAAGLDIRYGY